jgi:hypothetical protein
MDKAPLIEAPLIEAWLRRKYVVRTNRGIDYVEAAVDDLAKELERFIAAHHLVDDRQVCICGFLHPVRPQAEWTDEDIRAVVAHQNFHSPMKD